MTSWSATPSSLRAVKRTLTTNVLRMGQRSYQSGPTFPARSELAPVDYQARADQVRARVRTRHRHSDTWSNPSASSPVRVVSVHSQSIAGKRREHSSQRSTRRSIFAKGYARVLGATDLEQPDRTRLRNAWRPPR